MTIDPRITAYRNTPNKSYRQNVPRKGVCLHGAAMTSFDGLRYLAMGGKQVSAERIVEDTNNEDLMSNAFRAWSLSSAWGDSSFRTIECCNESTDGWTISDTSHWTMALDVAAWAQEDGFWPHRTGHPQTWTVIGHREVYTIWGESYATACPGGMDLDLVTRRAQMILGGTAPAGFGGIPIPQRAKDHDMLFLRVDSDGNGKPYFTVLNTNTNVYYPPVYSVAPTGWTKAFGPHVEFTRAEFIGLLSAIQTVTGQKPWIGSIPK